MSEVSYLTKNGIRRIIESGKPQLTDDEFVFQIVEFKSFEGDEKKKNIKLRLKLSDGIASVMTLVNNTAYDGMKDLKYGTNSVIAIKGFKINKVKDKNVIILENPFRVLGSWDTIGDPKGYETLSKADFTKSLNLWFKRQKENINETNEPQAKVETTKLTIPEKKQEAKVPAPEPKEEKKYKSKGFVSIASSEPVEEYTPIAALNPMSSNWMIKARVTKKGVPRHWKNFRGEGELLNIELVDENGDQIQGTFFNNHVDKFKDHIHENKVYAFRNGQVKQSNSRYTSIKNEYAITFGKDTEITLLEDDDKIKTDGFSYSSIDEISKMENGKIADVKGVVINVENMDEITMKNGTTKPIRRVQIADGSREPGISIQVTFWGKIAYKANFEIGDVIGLKDAKVGTYNAISLNMSDECEIKRLKNDKELLEWYNGVPNIKYIIQLSEQTKNKFQFKESGLQPELISDILKKVRDDIEEQTTPNYVIEGYLTFIARADTMVYMAWPEDKKKLQKDFGKEGWYWERWDKYYENPSATYMINAKLSDGTGAIFAAFYAEQAEQLLSGYTAQEFMDFQVYASEQDIKEKINEFLYKPVRILVKARLNEFGSDSNGVKWFGQKVYGYKYNAHNLTLINKLKECIKNSK